MSRRFNAIKVLTDLENGPTCVSIDMQVLKDLKRTLVFLQSSGIAGDRPPRYAPRRFLWLGRAQTGQDLAILTYRLYPVWINEKEN